MKIQFDSNQGHQLAAVDAVIHLFDGQSARGKVEALGRDRLPYFQNQLDLGPKRLHQNLRKVQRLYNLPQSPELGGHNFSIEMETGTGKTYVYLRTIHELHKRYGFSKFIVVVPSVAIREGVQKNLDLTQSHFASLYRKKRIRSWTYDSKDVSKLRTIAQSQALELILINIDAFNKPGNNIIHRESDLLGGASPIDYIRRMQPIVILDEPQNMESLGALTAIDQLSPLCTLRYSATHRTPVNLIYRLDPVTAYKQRLVKGLEVNSVQESGQFLKPHIRVKAVVANRRGIAARLEIDVQAHGSYKRKNITVKVSEADLFELSGQHPAYQGYIIDEIDGGDKCVRFRNGLVLYEREVHGEHTDSIMQAQIHQTIEEHLDKELLIKASLKEGQRLKVLSLFFIDRVRNYALEDGKIRRWFIEAYEKLSILPKYKKLNLPAVNQVHNGYFAQSKGLAKDTNGKSKLDQAAYALIMRDKEKLLHLSEPLRFIFSHSALREGWDNPNVFQICTLNESKSEIKKRQEIGRGLRLPVNESGKRCFDHSINRLTVIANESYYDFAHKLQREMKRDCGVDFATTIIGNSNRRFTLELKPDWKELPGFLPLWDRLKRKTRYHLNFDSQRLIRRAAASLSQMPPIKAPKVQSKKALVDFEASGLQTKLLAKSENDYLPQDGDIPDVLSFLQQQFQLTRHTLAEILIESGRLADMRINCQQFLEYSSKRIRTVLNEEMLDGLTYQEDGDAIYNLDDFEAKKLVSYEDLSVLVDKSIYYALPCDNKKERSFARALDQREDVCLYLKLPPWMAIDTPVGRYQPDWAIVLKAGPDAPLQFLIRETSGSADPTQLSSKDWARIRCARLHYESLGLDFDVITHDEGI